MFNILAKQTELKLRGLFLLADTKETHKQGFNVSQAGAWY